MDIQKLFDLANREGKVVICDRRGNSYVLTPFEPSRGSFDRLPSDLGSIGEFYPRPTHVDFEERIDAMNIGDGRSQPDNSEVVNLTKGELIDRINRDIALWKSGQEAIDAENSYDLVEMTENEDTEEGDEEIYLEPIQPPDISQ